MKHVNQSVYPKSNDRCLSEFPIYKHSGSYEPTYVDGDVIGTCRHCFPADKLTCFFSC